MFILLIKILLLVNIMINKELWTKYINIDKINKLKEDIDVDGKCIKGPSTYDISYKED